MTYRNMSPHYLDRLIAAARGGAFPRRPNEMRVVTIRHDTWCGWHVTGVPADCNCNPDVEVGPDLTQGDS